jgi:molybdate transport system substrate-binding protein
MSTFKQWTVFVSLLLLAPALHGQTLRIAAAADLQFAMGELAGRFENRTGTKVTVSYGSSGNFRTQIQNGAPFDVFFSADLQYPQQLIAGGFADGESLYVYGHGRLVLWTPAGSGLRLAERGFAALRDPRVQKIAVANPEHAPYGRAAVATLQKAGLYDDVKGKLVFGENISQAAQFAQSGSAQVGIIALSLTFAEGMKGGEQWAVPADLYSLLEQGTVLISASQNKRAARAFLEFVKSEEGRRILERYGFTLAAQPQKP